MPPKVRRPTRTGGRRSRCRARAGTRRARWSGVERRDRAGRISAAPQESASGDRVGLRPRAAPSGRRRAEMAADLVADHQSGARYPACQADAVPECGHRARCRQLEVRAVLEQACDHEPQRHAIDAVAVSAQQPFARVRIAFLPGPQASVVGVLCQPARASRCDPRHVRSRSAEDSCSAA